MDNFIKDHAIKVLDVGYITTLYFIFALICSFIIDKIFNNYDRENNKNKNLLRLWVEVILQMWFIAIALYIVRGIVKLIPFPVKTNERSPEIQSATIFFFIILSYQIYFKEKIQMLYNRTKNLLVSDEKKIINL